jgi:hypothetical protein
MAREHAMLGRRRMAQFPETRHFSKILFCLGLSVRADAVRSKMPWRTLTLSGMTGASVKMKQVLSHCRDSGRPPVAVAARSRQLTAKQ